MTTKTYTLPQVREIAKNAYHAAGSTSWRPGDGSRAVGDVRVSRDKWHGGTALPMSEGDYDAFRVVGDATFIRHALDALVALGFVDRMSWWEDHSRPGSKDRGHLLTPPEPDPTKPRIIETLSGPVVTSPRDLTKSQRFGTVNPNPTPVKIAFASLPGTIDAEVIDLTGPRVVVKGEEHLLPTSVKKIEDELATFPTGLSGTIREHVSAARGSGRTPVEVAALGHRGAVVTRSSTWTRITSPFPNSTKVGTVVLDTEETEALLVIVDPRRTLCSVGEKCPERIVQEKSAIEIVSVDPDVPAFAIAVSTTAAKGTIIGADALIPVTFCPWCGGRL